MPAAPIAFTTPITASPWQRWMVFSPVARLAFFTALYILLFVLSSKAAGALGFFADGTSRLTHAMGNLGVQLASSIPAYLILVQAVERRRVDELAAKDALTLLPAGLLGGALLFSLVVLVLWLAGSYHVTGTDLGADWLPGVLTAGVGAGIAEEIITRGALFRIVEEGLGTWWALAISALFFGMAHIFNPGATLWSSLAIAIEAGVLLALLYHVTRSLWPCIGLHAAWNIMQGTVYGIPVSGTSARGVLVSTRTGPDWLSGGVFGAEASVVALVLCSCCSALLLVIALRRGTIVPPAWRRAPRG
ncbi:CPBP family intramembrane glutamic endopeptidase [Dyella sp. C9]|uniref:CPBP family intramembrane glutamic endopeptidase n=1 Tax=Dyella sp. C9 TaxID=2202154 RepID=UPI001E30A101|nr:CPBP family intramembrane glutamic endopeptidase [Dyella sp. C9]